MTNSSARSSAAFTGRPALRASAATSASSRTNVLAPNEPPIGGATTRTSSGRSPNAPATSARVLNGVCVPVHSVSRPSSHSASAACGSIGAWAAPGVRNARLDDHVGGGEPGRGVAVADPEAVADVRAGERADADRDRLAGRLGRVGVQQRRAGRDRLDGVEDGGQLLVGDVDAARGGARGRRGRRRDRGDDVAGVARDVGQHALVARLAAVARRGRRRPRAAAPRSPSGTRDASTRQHARVGVRRAHERRVQHPGPLDVDRVALRAADARVDADHASRLHRAPHLDRGDAAPVRRRAARVGDRLDPLAVAAPDLVASASSGAPSASAQTSGKCCGVSATAPTTTRSPSSPRDGGDRDARPVLGRARAELAVHRRARAAAARAPRPAARPARCRSRSGRGSARSIPTSRSPRRRAQDRAGAERG